MRRVRLVVVRMRTQSDPDNNSEVHYIHYSCCVGL